MKTNLLPTIHSTTTNKSFPEAKPIRADSTVLSSPFAVLARPRHARQALLRLAGFAMALFLAVASVQAQPNIIWVSFHSADDMPSTAAAGAGFTEAPDIGYTDLLRNAGAQVTRYVTTATPEASVLNAADLVIISRSVNSGNYQDAGADAWNTITAPMMIMAGYPLRSSRMGFTTGTTIPDTAGTISLTVNNPAHAIFAGVALDAANTMVNPYAHLVDFDGTTQRGISVNTDPLGGNGVVLATVGTAGDPAFGGMIIGEWQAGDTLTHDGGAGMNVLGGHRLVFLSGSREQGITGDGAGIFDLEPDGELLFLNGVNYMTGSDLAPPPRIADVSPEDGSIFVNPADGLSFTASSSKDIPTTGISVTVNDVDVSGSLQFSGTSTQRQVTYAGFESNKLYHVEITVTNDAGMRSVATTFDTFDEATSRSVEAEDFNYDGGQYINNPVVSQEFEGTNSYYGNGYLLGIPEVDFLELDPVVRPTTSIGEWRYFGGAGLPQTADSLDILRDAYATAFIPDYDLVNILDGEWWNYTRDFSGGNFEVYLRANASADLTVQLDRVTSDRTQTNQTTLLLGNFDVTPGTYRDVPLQGPNGDPVVLELNGTQTLRLTALGANDNLDLNYFILVPTTNTATIIGPYVNNLSPAPGETDAARDLITATIVNRDTVVDTGTVELRIDGGLVSGVDTTPTATGADVSYAVSPEFGTSTTHTALLSYMDTMGNSFSRQWSFTTSADTEGPLLVFTAGSIDSGTMQAKLRVYFSELVDPITAGEVTNYSSSDGVTFSGADVLLGNQAVELTASGVSEGQVYELTVNNVLDAVANPIIGDSTISYNLSAFEQADNGLLVIEAESYHAIKAGDVGSSWEGLEFEPRFEPVDYSGGGGMATPSVGAPSPDQNDPTQLAQAVRMDYRVVFNQTGTYAIWIRGMEFDGGDSFHFGLDGVQIGGITGVDPGSWMWDNDFQAGTGTNTVEVTTTGEHIINVWNREDGSHLDKFMFVLDPASIPDVDDGAQQFNLGPAQSRRVGDPAPPAEIRIGKIEISGGSLTISGTGGTGGTYRVLSTTDPSLPAIQWAPVATNTFVGGDFSTTIPQPSDPSRFYLIAVP